MDTSKEYIQMCNEAKEIQSKWKLDDGDYIFSPDLDKIIIYDFVNTDWQGLGCFVVWLPRQDQLQETYWKERYEYIEKATDCEVQDMYFDILKECYDLREWYIQEEGYDYVHFTSMEQLWLAFVMKEKYSKIWNGEDWEIINE